MIDSNFIKNSKLGIQNVSRETLDELSSYSSSILNKNKDINLISSSTEKSINTRHIFDSAQTIDFIDFSVLVLIRFISLFLFNIDKLYLFSSSSVSRETY